MLAPTWISKASATQRAGRTGRGELRLNITRTMEAHYVPLVRFISLLFIHCSVRPGNVYRLYSRKAFNEYMEPFDQGEMVRTPLDNTILSLRDMLDEEVTPILLECLGMAPDLRLLLDCTLVLTLTLLRTRTS